MVSESTGGRNAKRHEQGVRSRPETASLRFTGSHKPARAAGIILRRSRAGLQRVRDVLRLSTALVKPARFRTLTDLAAIHSSDKGTLFGERHGYTLVYEELFAELRLRPGLTILEIGLRFDRYYSKRSRISPSLAMWRDYFPAAEIYGFDVNDFSEMAGGRIRIFQGDQGDPSQLAVVRDAVDAFDIVIDDGSHASYHQLVTLRTLFPKLRPGGLFFIEDLTWQPSKLEACLPKTPAMAKLLRNDSFLWVFVKSCG